MCRLLEVRVARPAASADHIQVCLKAITLWPDGVEHVKTCLGNGGIGLFKKALGGMKTSGSTAKRPWASCWWA